jgi:hypothetical protein
MNSPVQNDAFVTHIKAWPNKLSLGEKKATQSKNQQVREALRAPGIVSVSEQAKVLGLGRSTAWAVLKRPYKNSGLTAGVIQRMLASPKLPEGARTLLIEYVEEKANGLYGHSGPQRRRFVAALAQSNQPSPSLQRSPSLPQSGRRIANSLSA